MRFALILSLVTWMYGALPLSGADNPLVVEIWPGKVPEESGNIGEEKTLMSPSLDRKQVEGDSDVAGAHCPFSFSSRTLSSRSSTFSVRL